MDVPLHIELNIGPYQEIYTKSVIFSFIKKIFSKSSTWKSNFQIFSFIYLQSACNVSYLKKNQIFMMLHFLVRNILE